MTAMKLHRYPSPSAGVALGKIGAGGILRRLPYDAKVEYLQGDGYSWIDTGFYANTTTTRCHCDFMGFSNTSYGFLGSRNDATGNNRNCNLFFYYKNANSGDIRPDWAAGTGSVATISYPLNTLSSLDITRGRAVLNGVEYTYSNSTSVDQLYSFLLFSFNNAGSPYTCCKARIYTAKLYSNDILVRDLIPVRFTNELEQTEGAMYDRLGVGGMNPDGSARTDGLYRNRGTGTFLYGNDL